MFCFFNCDRLKKISSHHAINSLSHEMEIMASKHEAIQKLELLDSNYSYVLDAGSGFSYSLFVKNEIDGTSLKISHENPKKFWQRVSEALDSILSKQHSLNM